MTKGREMIRKTITITEQQNDWIKSQMSQGGYGNESELIRDLIRERQSKQAAPFETPDEVERIRTHLERAEKSGISTLSKEDMRRTFKNSLGLDG